MNTLPNIVNVIRLVFFVFCPTIILWLIFEILYAHNQNKRAANRKLDKQLALDLNTAKNLKKLLKSKKLTIKSIKKKVK